MFRDISATIATLESLRALGIRIAMDDFGTGYSSLAYLRRFPVDSLKIARELIAGPAESDDPEAWAFARAIIALGRSLGLPIVAEGIETPEQLRVLRRPRLRARPGLPVRPADLGDRAPAGPAPRRPDAGDRLSRSRPRGLDRHLWYARADDSRAPRAPSSTRSGPTTS